MLRQIASLIPAVRTVIAGESVGALSLVRGFADDANLKKTVLYDLHVQNGGERRRWCCRLVDRVRSTSDRTWMRRQDGTIRWMVHADPVQGLDYGLNHPLPEGREPLRCFSYVRHYTEGETNLQAVGLLGHCVTVHVHTGSLRVK